MYQLLFGTFLISVLHALIPSHWLPLIALAKAQEWSERETIRYTFYLGLAHVLSTVLLGILLGGILFGFQIVYDQKFFWIGPIILIASGFYFMYRHHTHHHFHIDDHMMDPTKTRKQILYALLAFMFLSPCLEIEAYFMNASLYGWGTLLLCVFIYAIISLFGMVIWVWIAFRSIKRINAHTWEHNAGIITCITMVLTGILAFIIH